MGQQIHSYFPDFLDGLIIIPLLLSLRAQGRLCVTEEKAAGDGYQDAQPHVKSVLPARDRTAVRHQGVGDSIWRCAALESGRSFS